MTLHLLAGVVASLVGLIPHAIFGDSMSFGTDFLVSTVVGGVAYLFTYYKLNGMREGNF